MKRTKKSFRFVVALVLVFALSFPLTFNAFALTDGSGDAASTLSNTLEQNTGDSANPEGTSSGSGVTTTDPAISSGPAVTSGGGVEPAPGSGEIETTPDAIEPVDQELVPDKTDLTDFTNKIVKKSSSKTAFAALSEPETSDLQIDNVIVVTGGEEQAKNRDYIKYDEEGEYYYTDRRSASMTDARVFIMQAVYTFDDFGITDWEQLDTDDLTFNYGGKLWDQWRSYNSTTGAFDLDPIIAWDGELTNPEGTNTVIFTVAVLFDTFYPVFDDYTTNIPYEGFTAVKKEGYPVFVKDPSMLGPHDLTLVYVDKNIDSVNIPLNLYDSFHTWDQINDYAISLKETSESSGGAINGRYVAVKSLAQSDSKEKRDIWNVVIAKNAQSVDDYLKITKPMMESNPNDLAEELSNENALESGYHKSVLYFNNVHPDEVPASDAIIELINTFITGGGLSYDNQTDSVHHARTPGDYDGYTIQGDENLTKQVDFTVDDVLEHFILVFNITENPDGRDNLLRTNEYGFDLNRDAAYQTQKESTALTSDIVKWDPMAMLEYHGYVDGLLIEPCTGPHDPNYEYDLYADRMLAQGNTIGKAMIGNTAYSQYLVPATDYSDGWDDGAPIYGPMFAMLYGVMGYTLEIPYATEDSKEACFTGGLALMNDCLDNLSDYYSNKLTYKLRGINNADDKNVDKYLKDPYTGKEVGRPRTAGHNFFPEYYVIPVDESNQKNPLEAYKALAFLERNGAKISVTSADVVYGEKTIPAGAYIIDMHQANKGFINSMLSDGYDASSFADIYAEIVISYPDMRNFDCLTIWAIDTFKRKTLDVSDIPQPSTVISGTSAQVVIQNDNIDVIKLVNKLLDNDKTVQILTKDFGPHKKGDFVINRADLEAYDTGLLVFGAPLEGSPVSVETIMEPDITVLGSSAHSRFILDMLGFNDDYTFVSKVSDIPENTDVLVGFNNSSDVSSVVSGSGIGFIGIGTNTMNTAESSKLLPGLDCYIPAKGTTETYREGLVESYYSDTNLVTANYDQTDTAYVMNGTYITRAPYDGESLITVSNDSDFFKAGWYPKHDVLKGELLAISGFSGSNHDVPVTLFANNIFSKAHAQHTFNMFANAVYLTAVDYGTEKPLIEASPSSKETLTSSVNVALNFKADRETIKATKDGGNNITVSKYKITSSEAETTYSDGNGWNNYTSTTGAITLASAGVVYIHAYAENTLGESVQRVFGPYNIGTTGGGSHSSGGGGGSSTPPTTTTPAITAPAITVPAISFTDISGHWAKSSIEYVVGKKLFSGISDTKFAPDTTMTRGMLVTVLGRAYGIDTNAYNKSIFTDVAKSAYYAPYIAWAYENKIVTGTGNGLFSPDKPVTRGEMAVIIKNYMKFIGKGSASTAALTYSDAGLIPAWGLEGVQFVTANGLMTGTSGNNFDFNGLSTRAQVATVLERLLRL